MSSRCFVESGCDPKASFGSMIEPGSWIGHPVGVPKLSTIFPSGLHMIWARLPVPVRQFMTMRPSSELTRKAMLHSLTSSCGDFPGVSVVLGPVQADAFVMFDKIDGVAAGRLIPTEGPINLP